MAGSRLERFGTVFTRVRDLLRARVIQPTEKPLWYDVYKAYPPKRAPVYVKPLTRPSTRKEDPVPEIFYSEDRVRAKFFEQYGTGPWPLELSKSNFVSASQRFVDKYMELKSKSHNELDESALFEETGKALLRDGVVLRRRGAAHVASEPRDPVMPLKLKDMLAEQQLVDMNDTDSASPTTNPTQS